MQLRISSAGLPQLGRRSVPQRWLVAMLLTAALLSAAHVQSAAAGGGPVMVSMGQVAGLEAQVQLPVGFDFNAQKWAQDAFTTLLQNFSDGIRTGLDALWAANFITQTPPSLTYLNDDIRGLYGTMQRAANAALALITTVGALNSLIQPPQPEATARPAIQRTRRRRKVHDGGATHTAPRTTAPQLPQPHDRERSRPLP